MAQPKWGGRCQALVCVIPSTGVAGSTVDTAVEIYVAQPSPRCVWPPTAASPPRPRPPSPGPRPDHPPARPPPRRALLACTRHQLLLSEYKRSRPGRGDRLYSPLDEHGRHHHCPRRDHLGPRAKPIAKMAADTVKKAVDSASQVGASVGNAAKGAVIGAVRGSSEVGVESLEATFALKLPGSPCCCSTSATGARARGVRVARLPRAR